MLVSTVVWFAKQNSRQALLADDAPTSGKLVGIKIWWNNMTNIGPKYGYFPNASKTWLILKDEYLEEAEQLSQGTGAKIFCDRKNHLGSAIGSRRSVESYVEEMDGRSNLNFFKMNDLATGSICIHSWY